MIPIVLKDVSRQFGSTTAVDRINLRIEPGELFFLLGPSGCGKTTLLRMIAGLIEPTGGQILFGQREVTHLPTSDRNSAMVFQGYALWPHMTVAANVAFGLDVRKIDPSQKLRRVNEALAAVRMSDYADRKPAQLSGGQQQRVALARALVVQPDVLLLDEPLSNLDAKLRLEMRTEIRRICRQSQITSIYVTHDQEEALTMADRIAVMRDGRLCQVDSPRVVYDSPSSEFVASFIGQTNIFPATLQKNVGQDVIVDTKIGLLRGRLSNAQAHSPTGQVCCSIRPESIDILNNGDSSDNVIQGQYIEGSYLGHSAQHLIDAGGYKIKVHQSNIHQVIEPGTMLKLGFSHRDLVILHT